MKIGAGCEVRLSRRPSTKSFLNRARIGIAIGTQSTSACGQVRPCVLLLVAVGQLQGRQRIGDVIIC